MVYSVCLWIMIRYDPKLVVLTRNFFVLSTNMDLLELSLNIHEGKGYVPMS